ncbi:MAG: family 10 glycosylhydrolase [Prevotellaceae bacterium]|nr:family 10 glycosylhydrolase [Prevotellaceae bacterium]
MKKFLILLPAVVFGFQSLFSQSGKHEMRAVWIATVANIDWPTSAQLSVEQQKQDMITMLNRFAENRINAIVIQIRPTADAFYPSTIEPWSKWLTGRQGQRPYPFYDPLQFIIEEAHRRCIEVHAWLNPYRVTTTNDLTQLNENHLYRFRPELFVKYGDKYYFNPGLDATRQLLNRVIQDIVERYDIDAIHFDDYFYPYPEKGEKFADTDAFRQYPRGFSDGQLNDWRRNNINLLIAETQHTIKSIKPWVEFGVSPFGVWRNARTDPRGSATRALQNYDDLYADVLKWLKDGTIDYVAPQLYWEIGKTTADYRLLVDWWSKNTFGRNLYIGVNVGHLDNQKAFAWHNGNEIARQITLNRHYPKVNGVFFFSAKTFLQNRRGLLDSLRTNQYKYPSLSPVNPTIRGEISPSPQNVRMIKDGKHNYLIWDEVKETGGKEIAYYIVYVFKGKRVGNLNDPAHILTKTTNTFLDLSSLKQTLKGYHIFVVTAVNRYKYESKPEYGVTRSL